MLTNQPSPGPTGATLVTRIGRRGVAGAVLFSLTAASLAAALPAAAASQPRAALTAAATDGVAVEPVRIQAEAYTSDNGGGLKKETGSDSSGASLGNVGATWDGGELVFDTVDLGSAPLSTLTVRYVNNSNRVGDNPSLTFYLDEKSEANKLTTVALPVTGSNWNAYATTSVDLPAAVSGEHKLIVVMNVTAQPNRPFVGNFDYFEFAPTPLPETFLTTADPWRYSDDGTDPSGDGTLTWTTQAFDDSAWKEAAGAFGSKRGAADLGNGFVANTLLQYAKTGSADTVETYHFRADVDLTAGQLAQLEGIEATVTYDDAVRIYVNGQKVAGFADERVEAAANKNLTYAGTSAGDPVTSTFTIPADVLDAGENTIAVALYQDRATSSDIYLDVKSLVPVGHDTETPEPPTDATISNLYLGVGKTEAERNIAWYSDIDVPQVAQIAPASEADGDAFPASAVTVEATKTGGTTSGEFFRDATFSGLKENTEYAYRVGSEAAGWSEVSTFRTRSFSGDFSFLFFGDPQVGASGNLARDEAGWVDTVDVATESYPDAELLFSAGDQVENAPNEAQYDTFLKPDQVRSIPVVPTNGNHDVGSKAYEQHFNVPNEDLTAGAGNAVSSGGDYWFIYKDVLFVNINSNSRDYASHNAFMEKVIAEHGDEATWRVLAFHHSIYSVASHYDDDDIEERRETMPETISALDFDLVLMGHDHNYTRSYLIKDGALADAEELSGQAKVEAKDGEVLYVTANSASGSKYYDTKAPNAWFASVINQERVRNYSVLEVTGDDITVRTLRSQANGAEKPVNSVVDEVVLTKDAAPELTVPEDGEIVAGADFDPLDGVSAVDNVDGDLTDAIEVTGAVDAAKVGTYTLAYSVKDARGNVTTAERAVTVVKAEDPGTGGPGTGGPGTGEPGTGGPGTGGPGAEQPGTPRPSVTPPAPAAAGEQLPASLRDGIRATVTGRTVTLSGLEPGGWHYVYAYSAPTGLGWVQADANGVASTALPASLAAGTHRLAVLDADGTLIGWTEVTLAATGGALAVTGADGSAAWAVGSAGALLLAAGGALLIARRRRTSAR